ncbi:hypothetical protein TWF173_010956 [Orbilia oligospora]|nr:hypothetical protein TWF173_010956 [Orbilia oligospora]
MNTESSPPQGHSSKNSNNMREGFVCFGVNIIYGGRVTKSDDEKGPGAGSIINTSTKLYIKTVDIVEELREATHQTMLPDADAMVLRTLIPLVEPSVFQAQKDTPTIYNDLLGCKSPDFNIVYHLVGKLSKSHATKFSHEMKQKREGEVRTPAWVSRKLSNLVEDDDGQLIILNYVGWGDLGRPFDHFNPKKSSGASCLRRSIESLKRIQEDGNKVSVALRILAKVPHDVLPSIHDRMLAEAIAAHYMKSSINQGGDNIIPCGMNITQSCRVELIRKCQLTTKEFLALPDISQETKIFVRQRVDLYGHSSMSELLGFERAWLINEVETLTRVVKTGTFRDAEKALEGRSAYACMRKYNKLIQNGTIKDDRERCNRYKADWTKPDLERLRQLAEDMKNSRGKPIWEKIAPLFFIRTPEACRLQWKKLISKEGERAAQSTAPGIQPEADKISNKKRDRKTGACHVWTSSQKDWLISAKDIRRLSWKKIVQGFRQLEGCQSAGITDLRLQYRLQGMYQRLKIESRAQDYRDN